MIRHRGGSPAASSAGAGLAAAAEPDPAGLPAAGTPSAGLGSGGPDAAGRGSGPRRHRADRWRAAFFLLAAAAILAGAAWALLGSKFLVVRSVQVTGPAGVSRTEVIADAGIRIGTPLVRIDPGAVARRVERITLVQSAQVRRAWPDKIVISVQERTAVLAVANGRGYQLIDRFGVGLRYVAGRPHGMPVLDPPAAASPATLRGNPAVLAAATVLRELPARLARSVRVIDAPSADAVTLRLRGGVTIDWGGAGQTAVKSRELRFLMRGHARHFDVSDPRTAVTGR